MSDLSGVDFEERMAAAIAASLLDVENKQNSDSDFAAAMAASKEDVNPFDKFIKDKFSSGMNVDSSKDLCLWFCLLHYLGRDMTPENARQLSNELGFQNEAKLEMADAQVVLPRFITTFIVNVEVLLFTDDVQTHQSFYNIHEQNPNHLTLILRNEHFMLADAYQTYIEDLAEVLRQRDHDLRREFNQVLSDEEYAREVFAAQTV